MNEEELTQRREDANERSGLKRVVWRIDDHDWILLGHFPGNTVHGDSSKPLAMRLTPSFVRSLPKATDIDLIEAGYEKISDYRDARAFDCSLLGLFCDLARVVIA
ncbi:MAG: hypothetical protein U0941_01855 [Planctomycetaceae bacterium]